jgi:hypothetical protein
MNGEVLAQPTGDPGYCYFQTASTYHLACDSFTVKVDEVTASAMTVQTLIYVSVGEFAEQRGLTVVLENNTLSVFENNDPNSIISSSDNGERWWKLAGNHGDVILSTSPDGATFTALGRHSTSVPLDEVKIALAAGIYQDPYPEPGEAKYDCFNLLPPDCQ